MNGRPMRRVLRRDRLGVVRALRAWVVDAEVIEVGWTALRAELRAHGWPARTPDGDRRGPAGLVEPRAIDYADPTGEQAVRMGRLAGDLEAMQDHWLIVQTSMRAMAQIAARYLHPAADTVPVCSVPGCGRPVERGRGDGYRGCELVGGHWVVRDGEVALCRTHRRRRDRHLASVGQRIPR